MALGDKGDQAMLALPGGTREGFMEKAVPDPSMDTSLFFYLPHLALFVIYLSVHLSEEPISSTISKHGHEMLIHIFGMNGRCGQADP